MIWNLLSAGIFGVCILLAGIGAPKYYFHKTFAYSTAALFGLLALQKSLGNDVVQLLELRTISKAGLAIGIIYGCLIGSALGLLIRWILVGFRARSHGGD